MKQQIGGIRVYGDSAKLGVEFGGLPVTDDKSGSWWMTMWITLVGPCGET